MPPAIPSLADLKPLTPVNVIQPTYSICLFPPPSQAISIPFPIYPSGQPVSPSAAEPPLAADSRDSGKTGIDMCFKKKSNQGEDETSYDGAAYVDFKRAETMASALIIKVMDKERSERDQLDIYAEATNGQMPNLDLINIFHYSAVHRQGLHVKRLTRLVQSLNPGWKLGVNSFDFVEGTATLASSMYYQALGVPTGTHGAFRDIQIDAITMELSPRTSLTNENGMASFLLRGGRLIEGVIRIWIAYGSSSHNVCCSLFQYYKCETFNCCIKQ